MDKVQELPAQLRPRERLLANGAAALTCEELLMVLLGSGTRRCGVSRLAKEVLSLMELHENKELLKKLLALDGIGHAKATLLVAALEFARRRIRPHGLRIRSAEDLYPLVGHLAHKQQEHLVCASLNGAHEVLQVRVVTIGLVNTTQVHPREVFGPPLKECAAAIIVAHNHPSGSLSPSSQDIATTRRLREAGDLLGVPLLDHVIFSVNGFRSLAADGPRGGF